VQYLSFLLNDVRYAMDVSIVETVVDQTTTTAIPSPLDYVEGVIDLRGRIVPVISLRRKFHLAEGLGGGAGSIIVFNAGTFEGKPRVMGALVDAVAEVLALDDACIEVDSLDGKGLWERYVRGIVRNGDRIIVILEAAGLSPAEELGLIEAT
jgi:purine-binding chemotaxis protein CheW